MLLCTAPSCAVLHSTGVTFRNRQLLKDFTHFQGSLYLARNICTLSLPLPPLSLILSLSLSLSLSLPLPLFPSLSSLLFTPLPFISPFSFLSLTLLLIDSSCKCFVPLYRLEEVYIEQQSNSGFGVEALSVLIKKHGKT